MIAKIRSVDFLPEIFQTPVNKQFLSATLDQLIQEPKFNTTQGYIGRRVGPGVTPSDSYVVEPTKQRTDYQLEPGVVSINNTTSKINDAITYPGMLDALELQGAYTNKATRLFESEYYTWDPFVDFDKLVNYSQYYWLPAGPIAVDVSATEVPATDDFIVTRANGVYTFSGYSGNNPAITLLRNGSYNFIVAQNDSVAVDFRVQNNGSRYWIIDYQNNPTLELVRGNTYTFNLSVDGFYPFYIKTQPTYGTTNVYDNGVTNNGASEGLITFTVPQDAPDTLYYVNPAEFNLRGTMNIVDAQPGTGPGFWIQAAPGVSGKLPWSPNISSRDVLGVLNNGTDLGTVTFNVPDALAQSFYTSMPSIGKVDLIVPNLKFNQINGIAVSEFLAANPTGIDGITNLNGRTLVFTTQITDPESGGWEINTPFDPLIRTTGNRVSQQTGFDSWFTPPDLTTPGLFDPITRSTGNAYSAQVSFDLTGVPAGYPSEPYDSVPYETISTAITGTIDPQDSQPGSFDTIATVITGAVDPEDGLPGSFDSLPYDLGTPITDQAVQFSVWQIQYVNDADGVPFIQLNSVEPVANLNQFSIAYGTEYVNTNWYKDSNGFFIQMPLLTATLDTLYYQDGTDPEIFGAIKLIDGDVNASINIITDILGKKNYTSPNGVVFTNGLKVIFRGNVSPSTYQNKEYYVYGVGESITLTPVAVFVTPEQSTQVVSVGYDSTPYDTTAYDQSLNEPIDPNYMTINMASIDQNPWSRSNRWFHIDVIRQAAAYNNTEPLFVNAQRAKRPILEFRANTRLFNFGSEAIPPINVIDFTVTDALSNINGSIGYSIDGYPLQQNSLVVFAADADPNVRNQVYKVNMIVVDPLVSTTPIIDLVPTSYSPVLANQNTVCLSGDTLKGTSFYYDGTEWIQTQQKTKTNQPPLFDVYDSRGISFGDSTYYPSTNFGGCKLFSYAENPANTEDPVLGIPLAFFSLNNIGDIEFANNLYTDTFTYTPVSAGVTVNVSSGFVRQYIDRVNFTREIGWQTAAIPSTQRQQFQFSYDGTPLQLDITVDLTAAVPPVQIFINNVYQPTNTYTVNVNTTTNVTLITLTGTGYTAGDIIEVAVLSDQVSSLGFYQVPINLENNPFNANSPFFTLGTARSHYATICENLLDFRGPINGPNNSRDLGDIIPYGTQILQQSSPLTLAGYFLRSQEYNIWGAIEFNSREYIKYKNKLLTAVANMDITTTMTVPQILDAAILEINANFTSASPFYWSDMLPSGTDYVSNSTTVTPITTATFNTVQTYDFTKSNYLGLLVYVNGFLLLRGTEYTVSTDAPKLTILIPLSVGDVVTINEYPTTVGNWCPNTPSKMGLYPKYRPEIFLDETYTDPTLVIRGHDGSITVAFEDIRDEVLLEFEKRIYDNIKVDDNPIPLSTEEVTPNFFPAQTTGLLPGFFRPTPYTYTEINTILSESFLTWVGQNNINYTQQDYQENNPFTYNYSQSGNRINEQPLLGNWRGIYRYFYDTETPNTTPWEMLGFSEMPAWWELRYGPAPYTSGNMVLWDDLEIGLVADPLVPYILTEYARPGLSKVIPVGSEGELLSPLESVIGWYDGLQFKRPWVAGDGGPAQASWWKSSSYPFAIMRMLAVTKPAEFFALFADRDLYRYNTELGQFLYNGRYRLDANGVQVYGNGVSKASYINWIVDYNRQLGVDSTADLTTALGNLDVRLTYRMAGFSDPTYLAVYTERAGPGSTNNSLLIPPESYENLFYKNQPFDQITYSAVMVQQTQNENGVIGYSVFGYSNMQPYFTVQVSSSVGLYDTIQAGGLSVQVPTQYTQNTAQIPYGYTFTNPAGVCDFLLSYGTYLESQGLVFDDRYNGYELNWRQMAQEFLYFAAQGWAENTMVNLNPVATVLKSTKPISIVDTIASLTPENMLLNQYSRVLEARDLIINRDGNTFTLTSTTGQTISFLTLRYTNYEDMLVFDNTSQYNDLIYDPTTGARQSRLSFNAFVTTEWDGQLNAQGFITNLNNVKPWETYHKYTKGEIVSYKNTYWQALDIVQPSEKFDYNVWTKSDYQLIDRGLLPNLANKADQLANTYSIYDVNLASDNDLFAFGLIGFRPRQYMSDLNLDSVTQVQLYQQFLGTKGTRRAAELFTRADLGKESGAYKIYENWAILAGTYGSQANRSFFELNLSENLLKSNPSTVQIINPGETSEANQTILLQNIWKESYKINSTNILPTIYESNNGFPSAGYVCLDDVDITVFDIKDPSSIDANIDIIGIGTYIWIAKVNSYDWGVYRTNLTPGVLSLVSDNYDGTSIATFTKAHGLKTGDTIIIKEFNDSINGVYRVLSAPTITTITIAFAFVNTNQTVVSGTGLVYELQSARVSQASDISTLAYVNRLIPGEKVWVDNNGDGHWVVVEKQEPFTLSRTINSGLVASAKFGTSVGQTADNFSALVGAPGANSGTGALYNYVRDPDLDYTFSNILYLGATGTAGYGNAISIGTSTWAAVGANLSNSGTGYVAILYRSNTSGEFITSQLLVAPNGQQLIALYFGTSLTISHDERWLYIGAPIANTVYVYGRVDVETQTATYTTNGLTNTFNYSNTIQIDSTKPNQLTVMLGNRTAVLGNDYTINSNSVIFNEIPARDQPVAISRKQTAQLDQHTYYGVQQDFTSGGGIGAAFTVSNTRGSYYVLLENSGLNYDVGDTLTISYTQIDPTGSSANNLTITVVSVDPSNGNIIGFTTAGSGVSTTTIFALNTFLYTATTIETFSVTVNGTIQRPLLDYIFNNSTTQLTFLTVPPAGAIIEVNAGTNWQYSSSIYNSSFGSTANFGASLATSTDGRALFVGAPQADADGVSLAGQTCVYDRSVFRYLVSNTLQTTYAIPGTVTGPLTVSVNGTYLLSTSQSLNGQYSISGSNVVFTNISFTAGDNIEIGTNQFTLLQTFASKTPTYEASYGFAIDSCPLDCSFYVGAPFDSTYVPQAGSVDHLVNQSRVYGVITSTIANPTLAANTNIRINNMLVTVPQYPNNNIAGLVSAINTSGIPNVIATATPNLEFIGDGVTTAFSVGSIYSDAASYSTVVYVNENLQTEGTNYSYDPATQQIFFVVAPLPNSVITVVSGRITISVINAAAAAPQSMITVLPGTTTTLFTTLGFDTFVFTQQILSPAPTVYGQFGASISVDSSAVNLVVGSPNGNVYEPMSFDGGKTYFDDHSTTFYNPIPNGGVAYTYDYFPSSTKSILTPGQFAFGQQIYNGISQTGDKFATSVNYTSGRLLIGAIGSTVNVDYGFATVFRNYTNSPAWTVIRRQEPVVNVNQLNSVFMYNKLLNSTQTYFDFFDPLQGKILGAARRNIDYIGAVDPASYNTGTIHNNGNSWGSEHIGEMWWDTDTIRFIDPNQDSIVYASRKWGSAFPGSRADIYQWISSSVPPASYTGAGTPLSPTSYTVGSVLGTNNVFTTIYYFWVRGIPTIAEGSGKTLSSLGVSSYILDPRNSGIPYIAALNANTIALYNAAPYIQNNSSIISIGFDRSITENNIHQEYQLIADGIADAFLNTNLYRKFLDSFCGVDTSGNLVPDPTLTEGEKYGVQFRPRQSMFADRFAALKNYLGRANTVLKQFPIVEMRSFTLLNAAEPTPAPNTGAWNFEVANLEILAFQNLNAVPVGYKYLVLSDSSQDGRWTIYVVTAAKTLMLAQVQSYDTPLYWYYTNWYRPGYNSSTAPKAAVPVYSDLAALSYKTVPIGSSARVINNGVGKYEIYLRTGLDPAADWERVGLEDGTIQFKEELWDYAVGGFGFDSEVFDAQYYDEEPTTETRYVLRALNEEIYTDELLIERNSSLMLMFDFVYSEFTNPEWLIKTSLVDVNHEIRSLLPYQTYIQDNQNFVLDYFNEVKPYHVQVRQFNLIYTGDDTFKGDVTDYDVPAYYNRTLDVPQFISPILTPYTLAETSTHYNTYSNAAPDAQIWLTSPWSEWYNNYLLSIQGVSVVNGGSGYTIPPVVEVTGTCITQAVMTAVINSLGQVVGIEVVSPGSGYSSTAIITLTGGNGSGAVAIAHMGNNLVRSIRTTIKYDRYQYSSTIVEWVAGETYTTGTQVRYDNQVWEALSTVTNTVFDPEQWDLVNPASLSGADRTMGMYAPTPNEPGLSWPLLVDGVDYPGVQVAGVPFNLDTGYDRSAFDVMPFDNIFVDPSGRVTFDPAILDAIYASNYSDTYLGTRLADINVDGGAYVDAYSSHAPEELVPGAMFDTLDFRVYTTPGGDWAGDGHGFPTGTQRFTYTSANPSFYFGNILPYYAEISVIDQTGKVELHLGPDYTIDWETLTLTIVNNVAENSTINVTSYEFGGGNQLYKNTYNGGVVGDTIVVPMQYSLITEFAIFVNGELTTDYTFTDNTLEQYNTTLITFGTTYTSADFISLVAIGPTVVGSTTVDYSWSLPITQVITGDGVHLTFSLDNSLDYTNPVNTVITVNGVRARTAAGQEYVGDGVTASYLVAQRLGFDQALIVDSEVLVYFDDVLQTSGYVVNPDTNGTTVQFTTVPTNGVRIYIAVTTYAQAVIDANTSTVTFDPTGGLVPGLGDVIGVTTFNDTRQQRLATKVFVGPVNDGIIIEVEGYDTTLFDAATVNDTPGSYNYTVGVDSSENELDLGREITDPSRLLVTLNGQFLTYNVNYTLYNGPDVDDPRYGTMIVLNSGILQPTDVVMVTMMTESVVPEAMAFRIFQDMRGVQLTYRITPSTSTTVVQEVSPTDDIIYVDNASNLSEPNFDANLWGVITIDGERIMYRERDTTANTVSSLLRGTAGTGADSHAVGANVYDMGRGNMLPMEYQDHIVSTTTLADGTETVFVAPNINLD